MTEESKKPTVLTADELKEKYKHRGGKYLWEKYPALAESWARGEDEYRNSEEFKRHNMEYDLLTSDLIRSKVRTDAYAQNLYAALCNTEWQKKEVFALLKDQHWYATWRSAGGIVADLRGEGDYLDWYCSGMGGLAQDWNEGKETVEQWQARTKFVPEGTVTDEIKNDLLSLGWHLVVENGNSNI